YSVILGIIFLMLAGSGFGVFYWFFIRDPNRGTGNEDILAYVPPDTGSLLGLDIAGSPVGTTIGNRNDATVKNYVTADFLTNIKKESGLEFADLCERALIAKGTGGTGGSGL